MFEDFSLKEKEAESPKKNENIDFFSEPVKEPVQEVPVEQPKQTVTQEPNMMDFNTMQQMFATNMHNTMIPNQQPQQPTLNLNEPLNFNQPPP